MNALSKTKLDELSPFELKYYAERGILKVMETRPIPQRPMRIEQTEEFKKHEKLIGTPIHLAEACRKYGVALSTMSQWVKRGLIKKLAPDKNKIMLNEAYVAYCVDVLRSHDKSKGKWIFDTNGTPYIKTSR